MSEYTEYVKQLECPELDPVKAVQQLLLEHKEALREAALLRRILIQLILSRGENGELLVDTAFGAEARQEVESGAQIECWGPKLVLLRGKNHV